MGEVESKWSSYLEYSEYYTIQLKNPENNDNFFDPCFIKKSWEDRIRVEALEGNFEELRLSKFTNKKNEEVETVQLLLKDDNGVFVISTSWTSIGRNLVNSLASADKLGKIYISLYIKNKGYPSLCLKNNDEKLSWKLDIEEQRKLTTPITNPKTWKVTQNDYTDLEEKLKTFISDINNKKDDGINHEEVKPKKRSAKDMEEPVNIEDIPF